MLKLLTTTNFIKKKLQIDLTINMIYVISKDYK